MRNKILLIPAVLMITVMSASAALAFTFPWDLFGDAALTSPAGADGNVARLRSDATPGFGGVDFDTPNRLSLADLNRLALSYNVTDDDCGAGSPRIQLNTPEGNIFVYIGPTPGFTDCPTGWQNTGNLVTSGDARWDVSQVGGGGTYLTYEQALAALGDIAITGVQVVVDSGFSEEDAEQTILIDNVRINRSLTTFGTGRNGEEDESDPDEDESDPDQDESDPDEDESD